MGWDGLGTAWGRSGRRTRPGSAAGDDSCGPWAGAGGCSGPGFVDGAMRRKLIRVTCVVSAPRTTVLEKLELGYTGAGTGEDPGEAGEPKQSAGVQGVQSGPFPW